MITPLKKVRLGKTDLFVTPYCQGTAFRHLGRHADDPMAEKVLRHCLDIGINFFDTAQAYGWGGSEKLLGNVIRDRRTDCVICTKVPPNIPPDREDATVPDATFSAAHLTSCLEESLKCLQTDYVDLYLLHSPDSLQRWEEVCNTMGRLTDAGKIRYWGLSNHTAVMVDECMQTAKLMGVPGPEVLEEYYTVGGYALSKSGRSRIRLLEEDLFPVIKEHSLGLIAFSPMDAGQLSESTEAPPGSPLATLHHILDRTAAQLGVSRAQVCTAWVRARQEVSAVLAGPERPEHVDEMMAGVSLALPKDVMETLDMASKAYSRKLEQEER